MKTFRAAVVGTGFIGPVHVEALRRAGVNLAAIVGSSPEKSRAAAQRLGINPTPPPFPTFADGHREMLLWEAILQSHRQRRWVDVAEVLE